jgi:4-amino-4-deoxy-L-arabinose transferase-like glycosyltransferase
MRRAPAIVLAMVLFSTLLSPLQRELYVGDETKYSQVVREMREGAFFLPTLEGSPFTHKPPLHFWVVDLLTYVFGLYSIWAFVIPSLAAFALLLWLMVRMGGIFSAIVCGTSLLMWGSAQTARMDVAFAALLALAAWMLLRFFEGERTLIHAGVAAGLAFLMKGPMALVIPPVLYGVESMRRHRRPQARDAIGLVPALVIPLLWLVPAVFIGGEAFWREIFFKQTIGRAVGAWVHRSPPWFYLARAPMTLLPWFLLAIVAIAAAYRRNDEQAKFAVSWMLAVIVPYSLLSSKLDVYMMAMLPAVALAIARLVEADDVWGRRANVAMLVLFAIVGLAGLVARPSVVPGPDAALLSRIDVRLLFGVLLAASVAGLVVCGLLRLARSDSIADGGRALRLSTLAVALTPLVALSYAATALVPLANEMASTRPLIRAIEARHVPPQDVALYVCPHLWVRGMRPQLARAQHVDAGNLGARPWRVIVARRKDSPEIADALGRYQRVDEVRMIGKWFDVYER